MQNAAFEENNLLRWVEVLAIRSADFPRSYNVPHELMMKSCVGGELETFCSVVYINTISKTIANEENSQLISSKNC